LNAGESAKAFRDKKSSAARQGCGKRSNIELTACASDSPVIFMAVFLMGLICTVSEEKQIRLFQRDWIARNITII
jgi:hypothetical protein